MPSNMNPYTNPLRPAQRAHQQGLEASRQASIRLGGKPANGGHEPVHVQPKSHRLLRFVLLLIVIGVVFLVASRH